MSKKLHHKNKNSIVKVLLGYGFHLWLLLFVSNLLIFYSFHLFSFGAESKTNTTADLSPALSLAVSEIVTPTTKALPLRVPTKKPNGPVISLSFVLPGIGSGGGTMNPLHPTRNLIVYLYAIDVNSEDNKVKPLYSIRTHADFDTNQSSPTYTTFINKAIDLGDTVKNGRYQIAFSTDQALRKLVKDKPDAIGGKIVSLTRIDKTVLPIQKVIMGDMSPATGNNKMDIGDYNVLVDCFGRTACPNLKQVDLNDDGIVDGIDYNIMSLGFKELIARGFPAPVLPTPKPTLVSKLSQLKTTPKPKSTNTPQPSDKSKVIVKNSASPIGGILAFVGLLIVLAIAGFVFIRTKFGKAILATHPLPFLKQKMPAQKETPPVETPAPDTSAEAIAESTEIPIADIEAAKAAPTEVPVGDTTAEAAVAAAADPSTIDKTYYVKNKSKDDKGTWVVLTDDAGPIDGLLPTGDVEDGFERIKGTLVEEKNKKYVLINEILPSDS